MKEKYTLSDFDFQLPDELVAQKPSDQRGGSRLFLLNRKEKSFKHDMFVNLCDHLSEGDMLVFNNAKVLPARMYFTRPTGAVVEVVLVRRLSPENWFIITNKSKRIKDGEILTSVVNPEVRFKILNRDDQYFRIETLVEFTDELLEKIGKMPLPPYIKRDTDDVDSERYQTVYAEKSGAVAAPTAGLHFTNEILQSLKAKGVSLEFVTLDVSWGTFQPVREETIENHKMHSESFEISEETAERINRARESGKRVIAVGTTSLRVLESSYKDGKVVAGKGDTDIFIYPPRKVMSIDGLITNFHTPKSTLLMLISAFAGYDLIMKAYEAAVGEKYRFFSYGDSMFIQ